MAHKIESKDKVFTIAKAWHGLETVVDRIDGFGFEVKAQPLYLDVDSGPIDTHRAIVDNEGGLISVVKSSYELIDNAKIWNAVQAAIAQIEGARVVSAGSIKGRKVVFASVELDGLSHFEAGGEAHTAKLNIVSSHDGTKAFCAGGGVTRIVCANTVRIAEGEMTDSLKLYHTKRSALQIQGLSDAVAGLVRGMEIYKKQAESLRSEDCDMIEAERFLAAFLAPVNTEEISTRSRNQIAEISNLFNKGKGNKGETRWDLFNGVTEYFTHEASNDSAKLFESSEFGLYADKKASAIPLLLSSKDKWKDMQEKGKALLATA